MSDFRRVYIISRMTDGRFFGGGFSRDVFVGDVGRASRFISPEHALDKFARATREYIGNRVIEVKEIYIPNDGG